MDRCKAEIPHMVGAPPLIEQDVPIGPSLGPRIEIVDHRPPVRFAQAPSSIRGRIEARRCALGEEDVLVGVELMHQRDVVVHLRSTRPVLVPVKRDSPNVLRRRGVVEDRLGPLDDQVAVMVPDHDVDVAQPLLCHHRPEVIFEKIPLVRRLIDTRFPRLRRHRLILNGDAPDRHARLPVALDELREVEGPGAVVLGAQMAAMQHVVVVLHVCRRTPGARKQLEPVTAGGHGGSRLGRHRPRSGGWSPRYRGLAPANSLPAGRQPCPRA